MNTENNVMTAGERQRLEHKVATYTRSNPFRQRLADHLAAMGGLHAPPGHDASTHREEPAVALAREKADPGGFRAETLNLASEAEAPF